MAAVVEARTELLAQWSSFLAESSSVIISKVSSKDVYDKLR